MSAWGPWQQVSRLGNPLINEVIIPTTRKDFWNGQKPSSDWQFAKYYKAPEITAVANVLYNAVQHVRDRRDLGRLVVLGELRVARRASGRSRSPSWRSG